jgi:hypothetical protein
LAVRAVFTCLVSAALIVGCNPDQRARDELTAPWWDSNIPIAEVRLPDGDCLDLSVLPAPWRISASTTSNNAEFGLPGELFRPYAPRFRHLISVSSPGATLADYRSYAEQWLTEDAQKPSAHDPAFDVSGFKGYPADDGLIIYISEDLDAFMGCGLEYGCTIHDGIIARPTRLNVSFPWEDRFHASERLKTSRQLVNTLRTQCS